MVGFQHSHVPNTTIVSPCEPVLIVNEISVRHDTPKKEFL